jgi:hypothetical protein
MKEAVGMDFTTAALFYDCFLEAEPTVSQTPLRDTKKRNKIIHFSIKFPANCVH